MSLDKPRLIPKCNGGVCPLGLLAVGCSASCPLFRMAQMVVKQLLEPQLELIFDQDSYGYRPAKSAHQAVESCHPVPQVAVQGISMNT